MSAYYAAAATTLDALLEELAGILDTEGWNVRHDGAITGGRWLAASIGSEDFTFSWRSTTDSSTAYPGPRLHLVGATAWLGSGSGWNGQTGTTPDSANCHTEGWEGPFEAAHVFVGPTWCHVLVHTAADTWRHALCGRVDDGDAHYIAGPSMNRTTPATGFSRVWDRSAVGAVCPNWVHDGAWARWFSSGAHPRCAGGLNGEVTTTAEAPLAPLYHTARSQATGRTPLLRVTPYVETGVSTNLYRATGAIPEHAIINMSGFASGQILQIGDREWIVASMLRSGLLFSGNFGFAYRLPASE